MTPPFSFELVISIEDRAGDLSLNDVPVFRNYDGKRVDVTIPVTQYIVTGANRLKWDIFVDDEAAVEPGARAKATLRATPFGRGDWRALTEIAVAGPLSLATPPDVPGQTTALGATSAVGLRIDEETRIASVERQLQLSAAMPPWQWTTSPPIADNPETLASLVQWYKGLHAALAAGDTASLAAISVEKARELAVAFGLSEAEALAEIGLAEAPADRDWQLSTPDWSGAMMERAADNRLVRLFHPSDGGLIVYRDATGLYRSFEFWLRLAPQGWVMSR